MNQTPILSPKKLKKAALALAGIVHSRNLYKKAGGGRFVFPEIINGKLTVENLYTEEKVPFENEMFYDGYGHPVNWIDILPE